MGLISCHPEMTQGLSWDAARSGKSTALHIPIWQRAWGLLSLWQSPTSHARWESHSKLPVLKSKPEENPPNPSPTPKIVLLLLLFGYLVVFLANCQASPENHDQSRSRRVLQADPKWGLLPAAVCREQKVEKNPAREIFLPLSNALCNATALNQLLSA